MTAFRITMTGIVKNVGHRNVGDKTVTEFSLCRKNKTKEGEPDAFTWVRGTIWDAPEWMTAKLVKGADVTAINGDLTLRKYTGKDGKEQVSADAKFSSFDVQVHGAATTGEAAQPAATQAPKRPTAASADDGEAPF